MTQRPPKPVTQKPPRSPRQADASSQGKADAAFDLWLKRGLHQIYDDVAREPIPEELLKLIRDDRPE